MAALYQDQEYQLLSDYPNNLKRAIDKKRRAKKRARNFEEVEKRVKVKNKIRKACIGITNGGWKRHCNKSARNIKKKSEQILKSGGIPTTNLSNKKKRVRNAAAAITIQRSNPKKTKTLSTSTTRLRLLTLRPLRSASKEALEAQEAGGTKRTTTTTTTTTTNKATVDLEELVFDVVSN